MPLDTKSLPPQFYGHEIRVLVPIGDVSKLEVLAEERATHITALVREAIAKFLENK